jgi:hypothetical protein
MNGIVEMAPEVRRTLILCSAISLVAIPISRGGSADSTYRRYAESSGQISPGAAQLADDELGKTKCIPLCMMTII